MKVLERLHHRLAPKSYLELGVEKGYALALARCTTVGVDPVFQLEHATAVCNKPACFLYQMTTDAFFASVDIGSILGRPVDFAFIDAMHLCEFVLRDFLNTERHCRRNSVIALHDCLPVDDIMRQRELSAELREQRTEYPHRCWWAPGDVWRCVVMLKRHRPELHIVALDAAPTGLVLMTNLDPQSTMINDYHDLVNEMHDMSMPLKEIHEIMDVQSTSILERPDQIARHFWLA